MGACILREYLNDQEIKKKLKELCVICDTREVVNNHITSWLDKNNISHQSRALETGDYTAMLDGYTFEDEVVIERKANLDEIAGNFTTGRERFEREMIRAKANGIKVFLVVENASWSDILLHNYRSELKPKSFFATLLSWQARFNLTIVFCKPSETGQILYGTLYYWARERLKRG